MRDTQRWEILLEIAGLQDRFYSHSRPNVGGIILTGLEELNGVIPAIYAPFTDMSGIVDVSDYSWELDTVGGVVQYEPITVNIATGGRDARYVDPDRSLGRRGEQSAGWTARLLVTLEADDTTSDLIVDTQAPATWAYPRVIHVDMEAIGVNSFLGTGTALDPWRFTQVFRPRGLGNTPQQRHVTSPILPSPLVSEKIAFWVGRRAILYVRKLYGNGGGEGWKQLMIGVLDRAPESQKGRFRVDIQPITTLLDVEMGVNESDTIGLSQFVHRFEPGAQNVVTVGVELAQEWDGVSKVPAAGKFLFQHSFATAGPLATLWPSDAVADVNAAWAAEAANPLVPVTMSISGDAVDGWVILAQNKVGSVFMESLVSMTSSWGRFGGGWDDILSGAGENAPGEQALCIFGFDLSQENQSYEPPSVRFPNSPVTNEYDRPFWRRTSIVKNGAPLPAGVNTQERLRIKGLPIAFYQRGESIILADGPVLIPPGGSAVIEVDRWDRAAQGMVINTIKIIASTLVAIPGHGDAYELTIDPQYVPRSFGDWPGMPKTTIRRVTQFLSEPPGVVLLKLLQGGTGTGVNGTYDVNPDGANIEARWLDEPSFLALTPPDGADEWSPMIDGDSTVDKMIGDMLKVMSAAIVMRVGNDGRCRLTLISVGPASDAEVLGTLDAADLAISGPGTNEVDGRTYNRIEFKITLTQGGERTVVIMDTRATNMDGGTAKTLKLDLRTAAPFPEDDLTGLANTRLLPIAAKVFFTSGTPRTMWRASAPRADLTLMPPGGVYRFTNPRLRADDGSHGVVAQAARIVRATIPIMDGAAARITAVRHPARLAGRNAALNVVGTTDPFTVTVEANAYTAELSPTGEIQTDLSYFNAGDAVLLRPRGDHDSQVQAVITAIAGLNVTLDVAHPFTAHFGTVVPAAYDLQSVQHKSLASYSDAQGELGTANAEGVKLA